MRSTQQRVPDQPLTLCRPHYGVGNGEPESSPISLVGGSVEPVKETGALLRRDAGPIVLNGQTHAIAVDTDRDLHDPATSGVTACVVHQHGSEPIDPLAASAFSLFSSDWFLGHLGAWVGTPVRVLRPSAPYRLDPGDYIAAHDDYAAPEHRVSVACNLTRGWAQGDGGETVVGAVENVQEYEDPDYFFPLKIWTLAPGEHSVRPKFNSALLLLLGDDRAHAVRTVVRNHRYSITTLYGTQ